MRPWSSTSTAPSRTWPGKSGVVEQRSATRVRQERIDRGEREGTTTEMREENGRLRREVKRPTRERDLLKRSVAFWVKEQDRCEPLPVRLRHEGRGLPRRRGL